MGVVLIMGCWNYPFYTTIRPLIDAIAAGNAVVIKFSEVTDQCASLMQNIFSKALDTRYYWSISGGPCVASALCNQKFDTICFTG